MVHHAFGRFVGIAVLLSISACSAKTLPGGACESPPGLETLAANQDPTSVAVDGTSVYWTVLPPDQQNGGSQMGAILKAPLGGGAVATLESVLALDFGPVLVDDASIYWFNTPDQSGVPQVQIMKADKTDGRNPIVLASQQSVMGLAIDSTSVYWSNGGAVMKVDKMGGSPVTLATEQQTEVFSPAVDARNAYYARGGSATINGVPQGPDGAVVSVPLSGGTPHTLVSMHGVSPSSVAVQGNYVYYTSAPYPPGPSHTGALMRIPVGGGAPTTLATESDIIRALAVDSSNVYWGGFDIGLKSIPLAGGTPGEPASCQFPTGIAVSDTTLYWVNSHGANQGDGSVMRLMPK
jgi:hypothetical protein